MEAGAARAQKLQSKRNIKGKCITNFFLYLAERVGIEPTSARKRADDGFEDREDHQAPSTLRLFDPETKIVDNLLIGRRAAAVK